MSANLPRGMVQIDPQAGAPLESLADSLDEHLAARAVLYGATPGRIFANDSSAPRAALIQAHHRYYLAGDPGLESFNEAVHDLFVFEIYPRSLAEGKEAFGLYFADGWEAPIREVILRRRDPIPGLRQVYETSFETPLPDWRASIPPELEWVEVSRALVEDTRLENLPVLLDELQSERESVEEFLASSFGVCLRSESEIVTWCLSEYNLGDRCEVGIATHPAYRQRGLAAATGAAFLAMAQARGIRRVGWHCWADNRPSWATALRLGLHKVRDYPSFLAFFNPVVNLAVNGNTSLEKGDFPAADDWLEKAVAKAKPDAPSWIFVAAACAAARADDPARAFQRLRQAIERGYDRRDRLETNPHLESLRGLTEWQKLFQ